MKMYDYIIVGAVAAGCVLANRLTEDPNTSVLLLEAGGNDTKPEIHNPAEATTLFHTDVDWDYSTEEEPYLNNKKVYWPRGKVLGGSSSTNYMVYSRGNRRDYDHWQELGNKGWRYGDVLPYFKKAENRELGISEYHGVGGPLNVLDLPEAATSPLTAAFLEAGRELGWSHNADTNGAEQEGFGPFQLTIREGKRHSAAVSYLHPVEHRPNLTIWTKALVCRVLFDGKRAIGMVYRKDGVEQHVQAKKEIILSGGAINSPQILFLSGVGPANYLRSFNIPVIADLPGVGQNLQDHPSVYVYYKTKPSFTQFGVIPESNAFVKTQPDLPQPNIQLLYCPFYFPPVVVGKGFTIAVALLNEKSRGYLALRSTDPTQKVAIYANYLSEEQDRQALLDGVKLAGRLSQSKAFAFAYQESELPDPQVKSDEELAY